MTRTRALPIGGTTRMPLRLLLIENEQPAAALMTQSFTSQGAEVLAVSDFDAASAVLNRARFDGIFLALSAPELRAVELTRQVRKSSWSSNAPIVLLGKTTDSQIAVEAFQAGGTFFLSKPLEQKGLRQALNSTRPVMLQHRRRCWRIPLSNPLQCFTGGREVSGCKIRNLSLSGILFEGNGNLEPNAKVRFSFRLERSEPRLITRGVVVRTDGSGLAGARFTSISPIDRARIVNRIAREVDNL
jgi:CheY-like chemotaxis protein